MAYTIAFFGSKPYDEASFNEKNSGYGFELRYYKGHLNLKQRDTDARRGCRVYLRKRYCRRGSYPATGGKRSETPCPALCRI